VSRSPCSFPVSHLCLLLQSLGPVLPDGASLNVAAALPLVAPLPLFQHSTQTLPIALPPSVPAFPHTFAVPAVPLRPAITVVPMAQAVAAPMMAATNNSAEHVNDDASQLRQSFLRALHQTEERSQGSVSGTDEENTLGSKQSPQQQSSHEPQSLDRPDFLSDQTGATRSNQIEQTIASPVNNLPDQDSPPFTSRSFDDLHSLLGKGLTPLGHYTTGQSTGNSLFDKNATAYAKPDTLALFTAESYAMFAQESALEASRHDAYLVPSRMDNGCQQHNDHSFDIEGMVHLVSEEMSRHRLQRQDQCYANSSIDTSVNRFSQCTSGSTLSMVESRYSDDPSAYANFVSGSEQSESAATENEAGSSRGSSSLGGQTGSDDRTSSDGSNSDSEDGCKKCNSPETCGSGGRDWNSRFFHEVVSSTKVGESDGRQEKKRRYQMP
jgi:hypothetical protein